MLYNKMVEQRKKRMKLLSEIPLARFILSKIFTQAKGSRQVAFLFCAQKRDKCKKSVKHLTSDVYNGIIIKLICSAYQ